MAATPEQGIEPATPFEVDPEYYETYLTVDELRRHRHRIGFLAAAREQELRDWVFAGPPEYDEEHDACSAEAGALAAAVYCMDALAAQRTAAPAAPPIKVTLCGSTRFWKTFQAAGLRETMAGKIVLSIGAASGTDGEHFAHLELTEYVRVKAMLDELHLRKIDESQEVLVLNVDGYIGPSTMREIAYALKHGKRVRFWEPATAPDLASVPAFDTLAAPES